MNEQSLHGQEFLGQMGERLRQARRGRGLTLEQLADLAGVTTGFVSQLERGKSSPSLMTLLRISDALGVPVRDLFDQEAAPQADRFIVKKEWRRQLTIPGLEQTLYVLTPNAELGFEALLNRFPPGVSVAEIPSTHEGVEWLYVLSGDVRLDLNGQAYHLEPHECAAFSSSVPHNVTNVGSGEAEVIWVNMAKQRT